MFLMVRYIGCHQGILQSEIVQQRDKSYYKKMLSSTVLCETQTALTREVKCVCFIPKCVNN